MTGIGEAFCFLGDSITEGVGATKTYIDFIHEATGIPVYRYGKNGAQTVNHLHIHVLGGRQMGEKMA